MSLGTRLIRRLGPSRRTAPLTYAVRPRALARPLGDLAIAFAVLTAVPAAVALALGDLLVAAACVGVAIGLALGGRRARGRGGDESLRTHETLAVTVLAFAGGGLVGAIPFWFAGYGPAHGLFEAVSGVTTTGLTVIARPEETPGAILFWRAWLQWVGGLGFTVLAVALAGGGSVAARHLAAAQGQTDDLVANARRHVWKLFGLYAALTLAGIGALALAGLPIGQAVLFALTAVSTAGFAPDSESAGAIDPLAGPIVLGALMLAGAVSFTMADRVRERGVGYLARDVELRALVCLALGAFALLWLASAIAGGGGGSAGDLFFVALSAQTTTGFSTLDVGALDPASKLVLMLSMLVGGDMGSTAGGMKVVRFLVVLRVVQILVLRAGLPRSAVVHLRLGPHRPSDAEALNAVAIALLFLITPPLCALPVILAGHPPLDALFDVTSALTTTGLATGIAGPELGPGFSLYFSALMLVGRVEILAAIVALRPQTWIGRTPA